MFGVIAGTTTGRLALPGCGSPGGCVVGGRSGSGWLRDRGDVREHGDDCGGPWPGLRNPQSAPTSTVGDPGRDVEESVTHGFRLATGENLRVADTAQQPGPGGQVGRDHRQREPGLVDVELPGREPAQTRVLGVPDAVLDPRVRPVACFEERDLSDLCVGDEGLAARNSSVLSHHTPSGW